MRILSVLIVILLIVFAGNVFAQDIDITDLLGVVSEPNGDSPSAEGIENIIDNNVITKYLTRNDTTWIQFDLDKPALVTGYGIVSANDFPERDPSTWEFQGWDETAGEWVILDYYEDEPEWLERFELIEYYFNNTELYSSYRLNILAAHGAGIIQIAELEIYGVVDDLSLDITNLMGEITAANSDSTNSLDVVGVNHLIDNKVSTKYVADSDTTWIQYTIDRGSIVTGYAIVSANDKPEGDPSAWEFQGWDEQATAWVTLHTVEAEPQWTERKMEKRFAFENTEIFKSYRFNITAAGGAGLVQIGEIRIFGEFFDSDVLDITDLEGVEIAESNGDAPDGEGVENLIDNTVATKYLTFNDTTVIEITVPNLVIVSDYVIVSGDDAPERDPSTWELEAFDPFTDKWVVLHAVVDEPEWEERVQRKSFSFENTIPYSRFRFDIHAAHGAGLIQISELYMYGEVLEIGAPVDITDWNGLISESNDNSPDVEQVSNIIDNDVTTKYLTFATEAWIQFESQYDAIVSGYSMTSANDEAARDPKDWTFEAMDPNTLEWVVLHSVVDEPAWEERFQTKMFNFDNNQAYRSFRFNITAVNGAPMMQIAEIQIFADLLAGVEDDATGLVNEYALNQNYPNPFNPTTQIQFSLPKNTDVKIAIYNMMGQRVKMLIDQPLNAGLHTLSWDGTNNAGLTVANGVYFYRMNSDLGVQSKKMMFLK
jgi:hypothetical protein